MIASEPPTLSVCIITYKRPEGLRRLLYALAPQVEGRRRRSIVVVNDGSHDDAYAAVAGEFSTIARYHCLKQNSGTTKARNEVARLADGDFIVFIDDDCVPPPFWLDWLAAQLQIYPELAVVAGVTRPLLAVHPSFFAKVQARMGIYPNTERIQEHIRFVTANLAIRREFFWQLGGFHHHENFPSASVCGEDTELASRVLRSDCFRRIDWDWYVFHDVGDGLRANMRRYWSYGYVNVWRHPFTISPPYHDRDWAMFAKERRAPFFLRVFRCRFNQARSQFPSAICWFFAALLASLVDDAYREGCRAARQAVERTQSPG